jgi:pantoate--beta-alanine ligase
MKIIRTLKEWKSIPENDKRELGFVPTMGALHEGHISLVEKSRKENRQTIVSIFLNKTQFNDVTDYEKYPITLEADIVMLEKAGSDYLFLPEYREIYPDDYRYMVTEKEFSLSLCGEARPGHFDGVLTVVLKLLMIIKPDKAYFGEKDYQQYLLIHDMARALFLDIDIIPCPIVREQSGLAMSSRNRRLSAKGKDKAAIFFKLLSSGLEPDVISGRLEKEGFSVDYIKETGNRLYGAVILEGVRLIDNVQV